MIVVSKLCRIVTIAQTLYLSSILTTTHSNRDNKNTPRVKPQNHGIVNTPPTAKITAPPSETQEFLLDLVEILDATKEKHQLQGSQREYSISVPAYFQNIPKPRIFAEVENFRSTGSWSERVILEILYHTLYSPGSILAQSTKWLQTSDYCEWEGVFCGPCKPCDTYKLEEYCANNENDDANLIVKYPTGNIQDDVACNEQCNFWKWEICSEKWRNVPNDKVTKLDMGLFQLDGTIPSELASLTYLYRINFNDNNLKGTIPTELGNMKYLRFLEISTNALEGTLPEELGRLESIQEIWLEKNKLEGPIPPKFFKSPSKVDFDGHEVHYDEGEHKLDSDEEVEKREYSGLLFLDLSSNKFSGTIPDEIGKMGLIQSIYLEGNMLTGEIPTSIGKCNFLRSLDLSSNLLIGTIPSILGVLTPLENLGLSRNFLQGTFPSELLNLENLETLILAQNHFEGTLPETGWEHLGFLDTFSVRNNQFYGSIPRKLSRLHRLESLDLKGCKFTGTIPHSLLKKMTNLIALDVSLNDLTGTIPELGKNMVLLESVNMTGNRLTGTIPMNLCSEMDCDPVLCPPGTFHPHGAANELGGCQFCPNDENDLVLGRYECLSSEFVLGDIDGDGSLSQREVLRLIYTYTMGEQWGEGPWQEWNNDKVFECDLLGVACKNGKVTKIDLKNAELCVLPDKDSVLNGLDLGCLGIPTEVGLLQSLEMLDLSRSASLKATIPTEIGNLHNLRLLNLSFGPLISGYIPTELGRCTSLRWFYLQDSGFSGTIPPDLGNLNNMEKINLSLNKLSGSIPASFGNLAKIKEILISRARIDGTLPSTLGKLSNLENLELYGNDITGSIPSTFGSCTSLKRLDMFNNQLSGSIPPELVNLASLQIVHVKSNNLTGALPPLGTNPMLSWVDFSYNDLTGKIPPEYGNSRSLRDLRLGGNRFQPTIPESLCANTRIHNGRTSSLGCDAILCPLGTFSETGYATSEMPCIECRPDETSLNLGSPKCHKFAQRDFLNMFYDVMSGNKWREEFNEGWKKEGTSECDWAGVSCDEDGVVDGLSFPLSATLS